MDLRRLKEAAESLSSDPEFERRLWQERPTEQQKRRIERMKKVAQELSRPKAKTTSERNLEQVLGQAAGEMVIPGRDPITPKTPVAYGLDFLGLLDRPLRAQGGAIHALREGRPYDVLPEITKGMTGHGERTTADALGMPHGQAEDTWPEWLGKEGARFGVDAALDPLNLGFGAGVATTPFRAGARAAELARLRKAAQKIKDTGWSVREAASDVPLLGEKSLVRHGAEATGLSRIPGWLSGTQAGKLAGGQLPRQFSEAEQAFVEMQRLASTRDIQELYENTQASLRQILEEQGYTGVAANERIKELFHDIEYGGPYDPETRVLVDAIEPLRTKQRELYEMWINAKRARGEDIPDLKPEDLEIYLPHLISNEATERLKTFPRSRFGDPTPMHPATIKDWYDPVTDEVLYTGKAEHPNTEVFLKRKEQIEDPDGTLRWDEEWIHTPTGRQVMQRRATKENIEAAYPDVGESMIADPADALRVKAAQTKRKLAHENLFNRMTQMEVDGLPALMPIQEAPSHYKALNIPGFKGAAAHPAIANRWHNLAKVANDPAAMKGLDKYMAGVEKWMTDDHMWREWSKRYNSLWKRTQLLAPGFFLANWISDSALMYLNKVDPTMLWAGRKVRKGSGDSVIPGWTQKQLRDGFVDRGILDKGHLNLLGESLSPEQGMEYADKLTYQAMDEMTRRAAKATERVMDTVGLGKAGKTAGAAAEGVNKAAQRKFDRAGEIMNKAFMRFGSNVEEDMKMAAALDWLKKNVKGVPTEADLDQAAMFAKNTLFDYGDLSPFMEFMRDTSVPFASWYSNIFRKTAADLVSQPQRLHRIGMFQDTVTEPMPPEEKELMPDYMAQAAPTESILDRPLGEDAEGHPLIFRTGRFLPQGTIEEFSPLRADPEAALGVKPDIGGMATQLGSTLAPLPKAALEYGFATPITGSPQSLYFQGPIDPLYHETGDHELARFGTPGLGRLPRLADYALRTYAPGGRWLRMYQTLMEDDSYTPMNKALYTLSSQLYPFERELGLQSKQWQHDAMMRGYQKALMRAQSRNDVEMLERLRQQITDYAQENPFGLPGLAPFGP